MMAEQRSYLSLPYAPAWGILIGTVVGVPIDLATDGSGTVTGVMAMLGLIVGTVIYYEGKASERGESTSGTGSRESRLRELGDLHSRSLISDEEYDLKRREILSEL